MKRAGVGIAVFVTALALLMAPAASQNSSASLGPRQPSELESSREVELTITMWRPGRVMYRTYDGWCNVSFSTGATPPTASCNNVRTARSSEDYGPRDGELVFTEGGWKTITILIADDALAEGNEYFTVAAWEDANADPWIDRGDSVVVTILDDDAVAQAEPGSGPPATTSVSTTPAGGAAPGSTNGPTTSAPAPGAAAGPSSTSPTTTTTTTTTRTATASPVQVASPVGELEPGPGFELTSEGGAEPAAAPGGRAGGSTAGLAIGSGTAIVGALAVARRRRRWSPTQA